MKPRPQVIAGKTYQVDTGMGKLRIVINNDESGMFEVFLYLGKTGSIGSSTAEGFGRLISTALRHNVPPEELAAQLFGIRSPRTAMHDGKMIWSLPHAVAVCMLKHMGKTPKDLENVNTDPADHDTLEAMGG